MVTIYGIRNCDSCRKAVKWLRNNEIEHDYVDVRESELNAPLINRWLRSVSRDELLNRRSATWRKIPPRERDQLNDKAAGDLILQYPTVMKRPVLDLGRRVVLGFDASVYESLNL